MHLTFQDMMFLKSRFFVWNVYVLSNLGLNQDAYEENMLYIRKKKLEVSVSKPRDMDNRFRKQACIS